MLRLFAVDASIPKSPISMASIPRSILLLIKSRDFYAPISIFSRAMFFNPYSASFTAPDLYLIYLNVLAAFARGFMSIPALSNFFFSAISLFFAFVRG